VVFIIKDVLCGGKAMKAKTWVPVVTWLCGLIVGLFPGLGPNIIDAIRYRELPKFTGEWTGAFKEWCPQRDCKDGERWVVSVERFEISQTGSRIKASALTEDLVPREWELVGRYRVPILTMTYIEKKPAIMSIGSYVLQNDPDCEKFLGYWTGYERDLRCLVTCPYILVRGRVDRKRIENSQEVKDWLEQRCVVSPKAELTEEQLRTIRE
jgi:hypothetical protein